MGNFKSSYMTNNKTSFPIENRYRNYGMYASSDITFEKVNIENVKKIKVYYPNEMILYPGKKYPLVIMVNGTGVEYPKYEATFKHLSSWGIIVAGNDDPSTAGGDSAVKTLQYMLNLNNQKDSIFFNKIDPEKIGISGHSQGGCGVFNAITKHGDSSKWFKCAFASSATTKSLMDKFKLEPWRYKSELVNIPIMIVISNGNVDNGICPLNESKENFDKIGGNIKKVFGVRKNVDHGDMLVAHDPYMTAWFCFILKSDEEAGKAFSGQDAEFLRNNENWQNCEIIN
jgi:predicted peptidase